jgi:UDP-N-acetylglucosamine 3-dehydrogenase
MKKVKVGIIGLGSWGECHLQALLSLPHVEIAAICDIHADRVQALAEQYGISNWTADEDEVLQHADIDLIIVVTFEKEHLRPVLKALQAGKHVLVEKPVSTNEEEALQMWAAAKSGGRYLIPGHLLRFDPKYAGIHESLQSGSIGKPVSMYLTRSRENSLFATYQRTHTVYELMIHDLDLAIWYAGSRIRKVKAYARSVSGASVPEVLWANLEFENGVLAVLQSNWMLPDKAGIQIHDTTELICEQGIIRFETEPSGLQIFSNAGRKTTDLAVHHQLKGQVAGALREQLNYVTKCILQGNIPSITSFPDAIHGVKVADAIVRSAAIHQEIELKE